MIPIPSTCRRRRSKKSKPAWRPPRVQVANLPPFQEKLKPDTAGHYRVLKNEKGGANSIVPGLDPGEYLVNDNGEIVYKIERNFPADLRAPNDAELGPPERIKGAQANMDPQIYRSWQRTDPSGGAGAALPRQRSGRGDLSRRSRNQRHPSHPARWLGGDKVRRAQGDADVLHHQGNSRPQIAVGAGVVRRDDRDQCSR